MNWKYMWLLFTSEEKIIIRIVGTLIFEFILNKKFQKMLY